MRLDLPSTLLAIALLAGIVPPGYSAYIGAYIALGAALLTLLLYGWRERATFAEPVALAILGAMGLVLLTLAFVYRGEQDLLAPVFILPMLASIAIALLARPARWVPTPQAFALICLAAAAIALAGGAYEQFVLGLYRPGLGNNPIHYGTLAAMAGCLALIGIAAGGSAWRYLYLLGPLFGLGAAAISGSRGPLAGGLAMAGIAMLVLLVWFWRERPFRWAALTVAAIGAAAIAYLAVSGNTRLLGLVNGALDIFRFTGGTDDIRAALYASAFHALEQSPLFGLGFGQLMEPARQFYPEQSEVFSLENLHADWANFAAMAGALGLIAYLLLLTAPLLLLLRPKARADRPIVLGAILLVTGQLALGLSNAMFGVLPQTTIYAVSLGYLFLRARRLEA